MECGGSPPLSPKRNVRQQNAPGEACLARLVASCVTHAAHSLARLRQVSHFTPPPKPFTANLSPFTTLPLPSHRNPSKFAQAGEKTA
jgi:hypothetical protein